MFSVHLSTKADAFLQKLDRHLRERIESRLKRLADDPVPPDSRFIGRDLDGESIFRFRIGEYRALYKVKKQEQIVLIAAIDKRPRVYDR